MRGDPEASPTLGVRLLRGSDGTPGKGKGKAIKVQGGHTRHPMAALGWQQRGTCPLGEVTHLPGVVRGCWRGWGALYRGGGGALVQIANNWGYFYSFTPK